MVHKLHRNALQPGHEILWYRVEQVLGQGGFGITYLAFDPNLHQQVAIKEYLPIELAVREGDSSVHPVSDDHSGGFQWGLERFISEARTLARFDHPNIVRVLSVFEQNNTAYMVMRYEHGRSLQDILPRNGTLEEGQLMSILFPILGGLREVHAAGFIHRDIKPANMFIREDDSPVLLDFGSARQSLGQETKTLTTLVSPGFAPFEQYYSKSDRQGPWTDIYGLGATLYRAAVGKAPADALDRSEGLLKGSGDPYIPALEAVAGRYSHRFLAAIDQALAFREDERPQSIDEWEGAFGVPDEPTVVSAAATKRRTTASVQAPAPAPATETVSGAPSTPETSSSPPTPDSTPSAEPESAGGTAATANLYRHFIGPKNTDYYLRRFQAFDRSGRRRKLSWNGAAALLSFFWLLYRRLYLWAFVLHPLICVALTVAASIPLSVLFFGGGDIPNRLSGLLLLASMLWPGLFGNAVYHRRARRRIAAMRSTDVDPPDQLAWLAARGGISRRAPAIAFAALAGLLVLAAADKANRTQRDAQQSSEAQPASDATPQERAQRLVDGAWSDIEALRLTTPSGENALEKVEALEGLDPGNETAGELRRAIVRKYGDLAQQAAAQGELDRAEHYVERALDIAPDAEGLRKGAIDFYIGRGTEAFEANELDRAEAYLDRARRLGPEDPQLKDAAFELYVAQGTKAITQGNLRKARRYVEQASAIRPHAPALWQLRRRIGRHMENRQR